MKYLVALGNPGEKYKDTRHNVGWLAMDYCIEHFRLPALIESNTLSGLTTEGVMAGEAVTVLYPTTYMNNSGSAVKKLVSKNEAGDLVVIHDDVDLPWGEIKVGKGRGAGGNNGVKSIIEKMGTKDFVRIRIGIAPTSFWTGKVKRPVGGQLERFVLKPFSVLEKKKAPEVFTQVSGALQSIIEEGVEATMNQYN